MNDAEIGKTASDLAKENTKQIAISKGATVEKAMQRVSEAMDATETRVFNPKGNTTREGIIYSKPLIDHNIRLRAADLTFEIHEVKPSNKLELSGSLQVLPKLSDEDRKVIESFGNRVVDAIINQHRRDIKSGG